MGKIIQERNNQSVFFVLHFESSPSLLLSLLGVAKLFPVEHRLEGGVQGNGLLHQFQTLEFVSLFHFKQGKGLEHFGRTRTLFDVVGLHNAKKVQKDRSGLLGVARSLQQQGQQEGRYSQFGVIAVVLIEFANDASVNVLGVLWFVVFDFAKGKVVVIGKRLEALIGRLLPLLFSHDFGIVCRTLVEPLLLSNHEFGGNIAA